MKTIPIRFSRSHVELRASRPWCPCVVLQLKLSSGMGPRTDFHVGLLLVRSFRTEPIGVMGPWLGSGIAGHLTRERTAGLRMLAERELNASQMRNAAHKSSEVSKQSKVNNAHHVASPGHPEEQ